jgi:hypothetical protein
MTKQPGLNLADLAPMSEDVPVGDSFLTVTGISAKTGLELFKRFPKLIGMISGGGFDIGAFLTVAPDAVAAIIAAASTGKLGDEAAEEGAARLVVETQFDILEAIGRLTFTRGFAPFAEKMLALADAANSGLSTRAPAMKSPQASKVSSPPDTPQA